LAFWPMEDPGLVEPRGIKRHFERSYADGEWGRTASPNSQLPISCFHGSPRCSWEAPAALASDASLTPDVQRAVVKSLAGISRVRPSWHQRLEDLTALATTHPPLRHGIYCGHTCNFSIKAFRI
jgi:hypothetical protein